MCVGLEYVTENANNNDELGDDVCMIRPLKYTCSSQVRHLPDGRVVMPWFYNYWYFNQDTKYSYNGVVSPQNIT